MMNKNYMAIDQYGTTYHNLGPHPRKELKNRVGSGSISKMYKETSQGDYHCGYVIGSQWFTLYEVTPYRGKK